MQNNHGRMTVKNITSDDEGQILKIKYLTCMNNYYYYCRSFNDLLTAVLFGYMPLTLSQPSEQATDEHYNKISGGLNTILETVCSFMQCPLINKLFKETSES